MRVQKRNGSYESISFDKVLQRIRKAARGLTVNPDGLAQQVLSRIYDGVRTTELDDLTAQLAASLSTTQPDWNVLAARIAISNHHKQTCGSFSEAMRSLSTQVKPKTGETISYVHPQLLAWLEQKEVTSVLDNAIKHECDYDYDYFGFKTLEKSYLLKDTSGRVVERPQYMIMRVAMGLWCTVRNDDLLTKEERIERVLQTYEMMSRKIFTHATPTLFNAGTPRQQLSSCFLLAMSDDSIAGIFKTLSDCAAISKYAGGIGLHLHNVRARGSLIRGTNGASNGLVPMLRVFNNTARYVDQGGGKRNGSFAMYLEPWHADVEDFLKLKLNTGAEEERARDLFYALWMPDLFMERVEADGEWSLFCPDEAPGLADCYGEEFKALYTRYEKEGRARRVVSAQKLWFQILDTQMETGTPYLLYKDAANAKSNQKNLGVIKSSNLCTEILEYTSPDETAVCNLASLSLPAFVKTVSGGQAVGGTPAKIFDFDALRVATAIATRNLNRVIDINYYPTPETERSNMRHRPIGLGVQGLADVFALLRLPWESTEAEELNQRIFEHIYYAAVEESTRLASVERAYQTFAGSPISKGQLQPDLWGITPLTQKDGSLDWATLRQEAMKGVRNSLLVAPMPTASTSQILGNNECFEPFTTNLYTRRTLAGEFIVVNKYLMADLIQLDLWSEDLKQKIIARNGSVQGMDEIPEALQALYKTSWEIKQRTLIDMAAARGAFICQSQSLNLFVADPNYAKLTSMHFYAWRKGLKTGCYYLRTKAPVTAQKFTIDPRLLAAVSGNSNAPVVADEQDGEDDALSHLSDSTDLSEEKGREKEGGAVVSETRAERLARLAREYEEAAAEARVAADSGEGCLMCSG